jgi:hypothetical protein
MKRFKNKNSARIPSCTRGSPRPHAATLLAAVYSTSPPLRRYLPRSSQGPQSDHSSLATVDSSRGAEQTRRRRRWLCDGRSSDRPTSPPTARSDPLLPFLYVALFRLDPPSIGCAIRWERWSWRCHVRCTWRVWWV